MPGIPNIERLAGKIAFHEMLSIYGLALNKPDGSAFRSLFADEVEIDFSALDGAPPRWTGADDWVKRVQGERLGMDAAQHIIGNPVARVAADGRSAECECHVRAQLFSDPARGEATLSLFSTFAGHLTKSADGEWKIDRWKVTLVGTTGNWGVMDRAHERTGAKRQAAG